MENQRVRLTKRLLKEALLELLEERNVEEISVKELCEKAEINRTTFYLHYNSQKDLFHELEDELLAATSKYLENVTPNMDSIQYLKTFLCYIKENSKLFRLLILRNNDTEFQDRYISSSLAMLKSNVDIYAQNDIETYVYSFLIHGELAILRRWFELDFNLEEERIANLIYDLADNALQAI